ncbi:plantaricin C family lantibiotic [Lactiplantibacillus plantarum]|uniref:plantaricin C family lantibiotic n=1 Tax=Lactiplantibacillus plantarum TaxID=1590 RepID=UPI001CCCBB08|nr:plantaricin C family lantibiotic [Lactiplantibacillus plantarum]WBB05479.1 plantaricin C family lantibiotic [Lactiplantibacillus plantarum]
MNSAEESSGNVLEELNNAQLGMISGGKKTKKNSSGDICTLTSECDHLATWVCC